MQNQEQEQPKNQSRLAESLEKIFNPRSIKDPRNESFWDMMHINLFPNLHFFSFSIFFSFLLIIIFIAQLISSQINVYGKFLQVRHRNLTEYFLLEKSFIVTYGEYYRLLTATFIHNDMPSLSNSILLLLVWGSTMEYTFQLTRTIITFLITAFIGNSFGLYFAVPLEEVFLGADAGIFGLLGAGLGYIIFNWQRIKSKASSKLSMFFMVAFIISISFIFAPTYLVVMAQLGGCLAGIFVGMITAPLIGAKSAMQFEEHSLYENVVFLVGALVVFLSSFLFLSLVAYSGLN